MQDPLAHTTTVMSLGFLLSSFKRAETAGTNENGLDLNLETPSSIILCAVSIESFCNEISSLAHAFIFNEEREPDLSKRLQPGINYEVLKQLSALKEDKNDSFYDRYKRVMKLLGASNPPPLQDMVFLRDLRDDLVHFRSCDIPIKEGKDGVICDAQETSKALMSLKNKKVSGWPVVATDEGIAWTLRISTNAMAIWTLELTCNAILYLLDALPVGEFQKYVLKAYRPIDYTYPDLFSKAKDDIAIWKREIFS